MAKRINVILTKATVRTLDRLGRPRQRSRFMERAVQHYVARPARRLWQKRLSRQPFATAIWTWRSPTTGLPWIKHHGKDSTGKNSGR